MNVAVISTLARDRTLDTSKIFPLLLATRQITRSIGGVLMCIAQVSKMADEEMEEIKKRKH